MENRDAIDSYRYRIPGNRSNRLPSFLFRKGPIGEADTCFVNNPAQMSECAALLSYNGSDGVESHHG